MVSEVGGLSKKKSSGKVREQGGNDIFLAPCSDENMLLTKFALVGVGGNTRGEMMPFVGC